MSKSKNTNKAKNIKFIVLDIDGVCTDGKLYYDREGNITKCFNVQDGVAIHSALRMNVGVGIISGRKDPLVEKRAEELNIKDYYGGFASKLASLKEIKEKYGLEWSEIAFIGDDWVDLDPMMKVGLPIAVANACPEVKKVAKYITKAKGGEGAVREAIIHIFSKQGVSRKNLARLWMHNS